MITPVPLDDVDAILKRLRSYLEILCAEEIAHRAQTRITRSVRKARFPYLRTIEEFDFTYQTGVRLQMLGSLLGPELVSEGRCAILSGGPGMGKTHLAVTIAYRAVQNGFEARFITADELIGDLSTAAQHGELEDALEPYLHTVSAFSGNPWKTDPWKTAEAEPAARGQRLFGHEMLPFAALPRLMTTRPRSQAGGDPPIH
jgi:hypothetical protein